jgi:hypothetical protein
MPNDILKRGLKGTPEQQAEKRIKSDTGGLDRSVERKYTHVRVWWPGGDLTLSSPFVSRPSEEAWRHL